MNRNPIELFLNYLRSRREDFINVLIITFVIFFIIFFFGAVIYGVERDRYKRPVSWWLNIKTISKKNSNDVFYDSYKCEFVKQNQETINNSLGKWVDSQMNKLGYVKYNNFFIKMVLKSIMMNYHCANVNKHTYMKSITHRTLKDFSKDELQKLSHLTEQLNKKLINASQEERNKAADELMKDFGLKPYQNK